MNRLSGFLPKIRAWGAQRAQKDIQTRRELTQNIKKPETWKKIGRGAAATGAAATIALTSQAAPARASLLSDGLFPGLQVAKDLQSMVSGNGKNVMPPITLPNFPTRSDGTLDTTPERLILDVLAKNKRVGIGEMHNDPFVKETLINMMPALKKAGVKVIYYEGFPNFLNVALDEYYNTGRKIDWAAVEKMNGGMGQTLDAYNTLYQRDTKKDLDWSTREGLGTAYQQELNRFIETARKNGIRVFGLTAAEDQIQAVVKSRAKLDDMLDQYVGIANATWKKTIQNLERHYPELRQAKSIVVNGALHNTSVNQAIPMDSDYPSIAFIPNASLSKNAPVQILSVSGSDEPRDLKSDDFFTTQHLGSPFEVRYPYRAAEILRKAYPDKP